MNLRFVVHVQLDVSRLVLRLTRKNVANVGLTILGYPLVSLIRPEAERVDWVVSLPFLELETL